MCYNRGPESISTSFVFCFREGGKPRISKHYCRRCDLCSATCVPGDDAVCSGMSARSNEIIFVAVHAVSPIRGGSVLFKGPNLKMVSHFE